MKILYVASEAAPFIKTGGLGDVAGALPKAMKQLSVDIRVVIPFYSEIPEALKSSAKRIKEIMVPLAWRNQYCGILEGEYEGITYYFIDNEYYFKRQGLYGHYDDGERFAFFSRACLEILPHIGFFPDIIHCNDWHSGLVPVFLNLFYREHSGYRNIKTVFTIHNIEYQGVFGKNILNDVFGISLKDESLIDYNGSVNIMKGAIEASDKVTTVSKTYAEEIKDPYFAHGLEYILKQREYKLCGIVNGIDTELYNPAADPALFENYDKKTIKNKINNKIGLQHLMGLPENADIPVIAMITRLTAHKGIDLVAFIMEEILCKNVQFILLGKGDWQYEMQFTSLEKKYPKKLKAAITFSSDLASKIYAGADLFLMPSKSEPCGLAQMIAMSYGTIPIVRETGGLKDTVIPFNEETGKGTGFTFYAYSSYDMLDAVNRALKVYDDKKNFAKLIKNAISGDYSWTKSAKEYLDLYTELINA